MGRRVQGYQHGWILVDDGVLRHFNDRIRLRHMVATAVAHDAGPIAFRYPRGAGRGVELPAQGVPLEIGKGRMISGGTGDVAFLSFGTHLAQCEAAAAALEGEGITASVADARFAKPLDMELIADLAASHDVLITVEEGAMGGFGAMVLQAMAAQGLLDSGLKMRTMCLPDRFIDQGSPDEMYADAGLTAEDIAATARQAMGQGAAVVDLKAARGARD